MDSTQAECRQYTGEHDAVFQCHMYIKISVTLAEYSVSGQKFGLSLIVHLNYYIKYPTFLR